MPFFILYAVFIYIYIYMSPLVFLIVALLLLNSKIMKILATIVYLPFWFLFSFSELHMYSKENILNNHIFFIIHFLSILFLILLIPMFKIVDTKIVKNIQKKNNNLFDKINNMDLIINDFLNKEFIQKIKSYIKQYFVQIGYYVLAVFIERTIVIAQLHSSYTMVDVYFEFTKAYKPEISEYYHSGFVVLFIYILITTIIYLLKNHKELLSIMTLLILIIPFLAFHNISALVIIALYAYMFNNISYQSKRK